MFLIFARYRIDVDGKARTYRKRLSFLRAGKGTSGSLDDFNRVIVHQCMRTDMSSETRTLTTVYPIQLVGSGCAFQVWEAQHPGRARDLAEQIAKALALPLCDRTGSEEIMREADHLDESLRARRRRTGEAFPTVPPKPRRMKSHVRQEERDLVLEIPAAGWPEHAVGGVVWAVLLSGASCGIFWFLFSGLRETHDSITAWGLGVFCGVALLGGVVLPLGAAGRWLCRSRYTTYTVRVSPDRLAITRHGILATQVTEIPAEEVLRDDHVVAFRDLHPQAPTHVLVIPTVHAENLSAFAALGHGEAAARLLTAAAEIGAAAGPGGYRVVINEGPDAGQSVFHLHAHVLAGRSLGWPPG